MRYCLVMCLLMLGACSAPRNKLPLNSDPQKPCIIIAIEKGADSQFKQEIISKLKQDYSADYTVYVKVVKGFKDLETEQYTALLVMDQLKAGMIMNRGLKNIAKQANKAKTVYFVSSGDADWTWKRPELKLVTSATKKANPDIVYSKIKTQLDTILNAE